MDMIMPADGQRVRTSDKRDVKLTAVRDLAYVLQRYVGPNGERIRRPHIKEAAHLLAVPMNASERMILRSYMKAEQAKRK